MSSKWKAESWFFYASGGPTRAALSAVVLLLAESTRCGSITAGRKRRASAGELLMSMGWESRWEERCARTKFPRRLCASAERSRRGATLACPLAEIPRVERRARASCSRTAEVDARESVVGTGTVQKQENAETLTEREWQLCASRARSRSRATSKLDGGWQSRAPGCHRRLVERTPRMLRGESVRGGGRRQRTSRVRVTTSDLGGGMETRDAIEHSGCMRGKLGQGL
ncbi:hypothetical protein SCP_0702320 [Sparassis crispa]|uniref:Uncharacterized protein n=1 Tax=Sparassis crispa TaxID=139825 RepID=A0A401GS58_9APHY|nr:hypothetical protein SCP_0702320 [Sparassis crispa]GBE85046.1 hypothetical protein SCP_0702320 [Sparassis crispa]